MHDVQPGMAGDEVSAEYTAGPRSHDDLSAVRCLLSFVDMMA